MSTAIFEPVVLEPEPLVPIGPESAGLRITVSRILAEADAAAAAEGRE